MTKLENRQHPAVEKLARALLATTCLTAASGAASASVIYESSFAPSGFSTIQADPTLLPVGATEVIGSIQYGESGFFEFQDVAPGEPFTLFGTSAGEEGPTFTIFDTSGNTLGQSSVENGFTPGGIQLYNTVPIDGNVIVEVSDSAVEGTGGVYTATLGVPTPEPSTLATAGLALAGALAWRRKRNAKG